MIPSVFLGLPFEARQPFLITAAFPSAEIAARMAQGAWLLEAEGLGPDADAVALCGTDDAALECGPDDDAAVLGCGDEILEAGGGDTATVDGSLDQVAELGDGDAVNVRGSGDRVDAYGSGDQIAVRGSGDEVDALSGHQRAAIEGSGLRVVNVMGVWLAYHPDGTPAQVDTARDGSARISA